MGGARNTWRRNSRLRVLGPGLALALVLALSIAGCGGSSSDSNEAPGRYDVKVVRASFPTEQALGQTSLMRIGVRNTGKRTLPAATVAITSAGKEGETSMLPFGIHDPQPGLAQPDRPVWVLAEGYPRPAGSHAPRGGATTSSPKTFDFGALKPGRSVEGIWKLSAVRPGPYTVVYRVDAGLSGEARAKTSAGVQPGGSFRVKVSRATPQVEVTDSGEVVEIGKGSGGGGGQGAAGK